MDDSDTQKQLDDFIKALADSQTDLPLEFKKVLDDNFWELLAE